MKQLLMQAREQPIHTEMGSCIRWSDDSTSIKQFASAHNQALVTLTHTKLGYNECYRKQSKAKALKQFSINNTDQQHRSTTELRRTHHRARAIPIKDRRTNPTVDNMNPKDGSTSSYS
jgi:hypothetical protein